MKDVRSQLPVIACSLDADGRRERLSDWAELLDQATARAQADDGVRYSFAASDSLERQIRELAAAEKDCCSFLEFEVSRTSDTIELAVTSPPAGREALRLIFPS